MDSQQTTTVGLVILTTGARPVELEAIMRAASHLPFHERVIVGNGCQPPPHPGWHGVEAAENLGVPGGRSFAMANTAADIIVFLDDDSSLPAGADDLVDSVRALFDRDPTIGALACRVVIAGTQTTMRRWSPTPSLAAGSGVTDVPTFPGNGHALRRTAFDQVGGYLDALFFKHEETELSWRLLDGGWRVVTDPTIVVEHPKTSEARHSHALELGLRNKLWIARLRLPLIAGAMTILISTLRTTARCRSFDDLRAVGRAVRAGAGTLPAPRQSIGWSTVLQLSRAGRPPIF